MQNYNSYNSRFKVYIASDHGGFKLKEKLKKYLGEKEYEVEDVGAYKLDLEDDYPDFVLPLAEKVAKEKRGFGIIFGRSGNGEQIAANKVKGIRAVLCLNPAMAKKAREDNDANILALGADLIDLAAAKQVVETFLKTPFSGKKRHQRRIVKIISYETPK